MPAVRDAVFAQEAVTTDGGLTWPMCTYEAGDLLFLILIGDAAITSSSVTSAGTWNQLFIQNNTVGSVVFWKYAVVGEPTEVVATAAPNDTYCGFLLSVRDAFQGYTSGSPPVRTPTTQASATRFTMPTLTTSSVNSLIIMYAANSSANPSYVFGEGQGVMQSVINGAAEGGALGWFVQPTVGTTPAVPCAVVVPSAGVKAVIEVRQPVSGASAVPAYCAADDSVLLSPNPGLTYDGTTAMAATADTNFGTSIGGVVANDATIATAVNDVGIDPKGFITGTGLTNAASTTATSGAEMVVAASYYNIGDSNILGHLRSETTLAAQNLGAIGTTRGVWFGLKSAATASTDYKVWQVHGNDAPFYGVGVVPFVVNPADANTRAVAGTLVNTDVRRYGFWVSGAGALTGRTIFGPLWRMGTTTVAGGTSAEPINIEGLEFALSKGKTRWSAIRQGANQMLCLQAVQFGDGGTNPINLDLNTTAVEFPSRRNAGLKLVNYNGPDNAIGFTYRAGASDTIKHRASVISSPSKYHWRIHESSSASATYDFSGLSVIGAGDVQLRQVTTFAGMNFTNCPDIYSNGASLDACAFDNSTVIVPNVAGAAAIQNSSFKKGASNNYHAIEILGSAGNATLTGLTFEGYKPEGISVDEYLDPNFANVTLLLPMDGANGSTVFEDKSLFTKSVSVFGNSQISTGQSQFGGASAFFDGAGDYLQIANNTDFQFGNGDFTIECWIRITALGLTRIFSLSNTTVATNADESVFLELSAAGALSFTCVSGTTAYGANSASSAVAINTWYHIALTRSGGTTRLFRNGTQIATNTTLSTVSLNWLSTLRLSIASWTGTSRYFNGHIDDFRVTKGVARYTANFTAPTSAFPFPTEGFGPEGPEAIYVNIPSGTVTLTISGGDTPSVRTAGATVNIVSGATVTFTGLPTGTDIVILTAGTSTILQQVDQNPTTSYAWGYSGTPTVDVGFIKPGFKVRYIRNLSLGTTDSSIPVELQADLSYV